MSVYLSLILSLLTSFVMFFVTMLSTLSLLCLTSVYTLVTPTICGHPTAHSRLKHLWLSKLLVTHSVAEYWFIVSSTFCFPLTIEAAKKEYFERNFAWHAISESKGDLTANIDNATVMFVRPTPDGKSRDRLGIMKTTYNLKVNHNPFYGLMSVNTLVRKH